MRIRFCSVVLLCCLAVPTFGVTTKNLGDGLTVADVANRLTGRGATITNVKITGADSAIGTFADGTAIGVSSGIILSTGNISNVAGPNTAPDSGADLAGDGHPALDQIVSPFKTFDAMVLEFDVVTVSPTFAIRYVFASEEYREFVDSEFNDVFAFFVDGGNIALAPGLNEPVTVNTINHLRNTGAYRDNTGAGADTQFDGFTTVLTAVAIVEPNVSHHIRIAIADTSDRIYDSAVLIAEGGISGNALAPLVVPDSNLIVTENLQTTELGLSVFYTTLGANPNLSITGLPADSTATFTPLAAREDGQLRSTMKLTIGPSTQAGEYLVGIRSTAGDVEGFAFITVIVGCNPPRILGTSQPTGQSVPGGTAATLKVVPEGSGPFTYQWFSGFSGMTGTPIAGATAAEFRTPSITGPSAFWVRVTNPCGTANSTTAFVTTR